MKLDLIDVFGSRPLLGNPLAVVRGGEDLAEETMQALARWLGFSETTFLLPPHDPGADYRLRIFTPAQELPFAGHPTLGSCHSWLAAGGKPKQAGRIVQQCGIGLVDLRQEGGMLAFRAPPLVHSGPLDAADRAAAIDAAGVPEASVVEAVHLANGPQWRLLRLRSAEDVLAAQPAGRIEPDCPVGLAGPHETGGQADWEVRAFFDHGGGNLAEDPVTGSFNAGLAVHLFASGLADADYIAAQGRKTGADGRVHCSRDARGAVWIGGRTDTIAAGAQVAASL